MRGIWEIWGLALVGLALLASSCGNDSDTQDRAQSPPASTEEEPYRGGEKSIEEFGDEAAGSDRAALLDAFHSYLGALADQDVATACDYLAASLQNSLVQIARGSSETACVDILPGLLAPSAPMIAKEQDEGRITKVRVEGDRAFIVFKAPGAKRYQMTMSFEGGEWKATTVAASVLVPDL